MVHSPSHSSSSPQAPEPAAHPSGAHGHHHHHARLADANGENRAQIRRRLLMAAAISFTILLVEVVGAAVSGSLALWSDAGHVFTDVVSLGLSAFALTLTGRPAKPGRTFGWMRLEILAAVANAVLLLAVAGVVLTEAVARLMAPPSVAAGPMAAFALAALVGNAIALTMLARTPGQNLPLRAATLEVAGDLLGAAAVLLAAGILALTGLRQADALASIAIAMLMLPRIWQLLREGVEVLLEAAPRSVDMAEIRRHLSAADGVDEVHDLHVWAITTGMHVASAHIVLTPDAAGPQVLDTLGECLADHFDIQHSTLQLESPEHRNHEGAVHH